METALKPILRWTSLFLHFGPNSSLFFDFLDRSDGKLSFLHPRFASDFFLGAQALRPVESLSHSFRAQCSFSTFSGDWLIQIFYA